MRACFTCLSVLLFLVLACPACSGKVAGPEDADASAGSGDASTDAAPPPPPPELDATPPPPPPPVDAGASCTDLSAQLDAMRTKAKTCCPICNTPQCNVIVEDVCCPFGVTGSAPPGYAGLLAEYKAKCPTACPATPCRTRFTCVTTDPTNPSASGVCQ